MLADSGFCRHRMLDWMDRHGVDYIIAIAKSSGLLREVAQGIDVVSQLHELTGEKQVAFTRFIYRAHSWKAIRVVLAKLEVTGFGFNGTAVKKFT